MKNNLIKAILLPLIIAFLLPGIALAKPFSGTQLPNPPSLESRPNILFVGNSLTFWNGDMPETLAALCKATGIRCCIDSYTVGGCTLARFADPEKEGKNLETILKLGLWDYVVLQGNSVEAMSSDPKFARFGPSVVELDRKIKQYNPHCKTVLFSTVAHVDELEKTAEIYANYQKVGREIGAMVVPSGPAWLELGPGYDREKIEFLFDYKINPKDLKHPSPYGVMLNTYVFYGALFGKYPEEVQVPLVVNQKKAQPEVAASLKRAAQKTLVQYGILKAK